MQTDPDGELMLRLKNGEDWILNELAKDLVLDILSGSAVSGGGAARNIYADPPVEDGFEASFFPGFRLFAVQKSLSVPRPDAAANRAGDKDHEAQGSIIHVQSDMVALKDRGDAVSKEMLSARVPRRHSTNSSRIDARDARNRVKPAQLGTDPRLCHSIEHRRP
jgi:hypothetical protein